MGKVIRMKDSEDEKNPKSEGDLLEITENLLIDVRKTPELETSLSVPMDKLSALGAGVAPLIPQLASAIQALPNKGEVLYRVVNSGAGVALKIAKNGNFWGAMKTAEGASKLAQLQAVSASSAATASATVVLPLILVAATLYKIEKDLKNIAEIGKQILSFLEIEKESEIEADVEMLMNIITNYKFNWDNEHFVSSNHKLVLDIQRTARKNMNAYQKNVSEALKKKKTVVAQKKVKSVFADLEKKFKYYRLSLYAFSLATFIEIMLSGNFKEEYLSGLKEEIKSLSENYRTLFREASLLLEKMGSSSVEANVLKGIGSAGKSIGKFIGSVPVLKEGPVDEFLQDGGLQLHKSAGIMQNSAVKAFASLSKPGTSMFVERMEDMIRIYNHTSEICFDEKRIYLLAN